MKYVRRFLIPAVSIWIVGLTACTRTPQNTSTTLRLGRGLLGVASTLPEGRLACFAADIGGPGIAASQTNACTPQVSVFAGFVPANTDIALAVPKGGDRTLRVFLFLPPAGSSICPQVSTATDLAKMDLSSIYLVATKSAIDTSSDTTVDVTAAFPGLTNPIATQMGLATNCSAPPATVSVGSSTLTAAKFGVAIVPVNLDQARPIATSVDFTTLPGTAVDGTHYVGGAGRISVPAGKTSANIVIPIVTTHTPDGALTFQVRLTQNSDTVLGSAITSTVTIQDNTPAARADYVKVSGTDGHVCAQTSGGAMFCWGYSNFGNIGDGTLDNRPLPTAVTGLSSGVTSIHAGNYGSCAIMADTSLRCWGYNDYGAVGDNTQVHRTSPVTVTGLTGVIQVERGFLQTCALVSGGVKCWGMNLYGQLGTGDNTDSMTPVTPIGLGSGVVQISVNFHSACALLSTGEARCWGSNQYGGLGTGTTSGVYGETTPVTPTGLDSGVAKIVLGSGFGCALLTDSTVKCWGPNNSGRLGDGTMTDQLTPTSVSGLTGVADIALGNSHACARLSDSTIKCWGDNTTGQIDSTTNSQYLTPTAVPGVSGATQIAAGAGHTCALLNTGQIKCWGSNSNGQLGRGEFTNRRPRPTYNKSLGLGVTAVDIGGSMSFHTCSARNGAAVCWGSNANGEVGDGTTTYRTLPVPVTGLSTGVTSVATGDSSSCAVGSSGSVYCWGSNYNGELGNGTTDSSPVPVVTNMGGPAKQVVTFGSSACALMMDGTVKCWGYNYSGQLGSGTNTNSLTPTLVSGLSGVVQIAAAGASVCALAQSGAVHCWGGNYYGQLGNGSMSDSNTPVQVIGLAAATRIAVGSGFACALLTSNAIKCWGADGSGQLGDGTTTSYSPTPIAVAGLNSGKAVSDVAAGNSHACALYSDGTAQCWGSNYSGQIGNGTMGSSPQLTPANVDGVSGAITIRAVRDNTCAITAAGAALCWGDNNYHQVEYAATNLPGLVCGP